MFYYIRRYFRKKYTKVPQKEILEEDIQYGYDGPHVDGLPITEPYPPPRFETYQGLYGSFRALSHMMGTSSLINVQGNQSMISQWIHWEIYPWFSMENQAMVFNGLIGKSSHGFQ